MNTRIPPLEIVTMKEVAARIKHRDSETAKKWCTENDITVHTLSKKDFIYLIDLEYTLGKPFVSEFKNKHPMDWKSLLKDILGNDALYYYFLANLGEPRSDRGFTVVQPMDETEKKMYKELIT